MMRGDVYLNLDMEVKESGSMYAADVHLIFGEAHGNSVEAERLYADFSQLPYT
jgi:hypothetical protein